MIRKMFALASVALLSLPMMASASDNDFPAPAANTQYCVSKTSKVQARKGQSHSTKVDGVVCQSDMNGRSSREVATGVRGGNDGWDQGESGRGATSGRATVKAFH